jgi:hypothetical protein
MGFNFARKKSRALQMKWQQTSEAPVDVGAVSIPSGECEVWFVPSYPRINGVDERVRRVADDEWGRGKALAQIGTNKVDLMCYEALAVVGGDRERLTGNIACDDARRHCMKRHADGQTPTAGTNVKRPGGVEGA